MMAVTTRFRADALIDRFLLAAVAKAAEAVKIDGAHASIDTTTANGRLIFAIFAGLAEFERELIIERTKAGLAAARARGRHGGRPFKMTPAKLRLARSAMGQPERKGRDLCTELGITQQTLYRFVGPTGELRADGEKLLNRRKRET